MERRTRDSVGRWVMVGAIFVLTSCQDPQSEVTSWQDTPEPRVLISSESNPDYQFVRIESALPLGDTLVVVADARRSDLRIFRRDGALVRTVGREGDGPGEFRRISRVFLIGDTIATYDWSLRRIALHDGSGELMGSIPLRATGMDGGVQIEGRLSDGSWVWTRTSLLSWNFGPGMFRDTTKVGLLPSSGSGEFSEFARFPGLHLYARMPEGRKEEWRVGPSMLSPDSRTVVWRDTLIIGDTGDSVLTFLSVDGTVTRTIDLPLSPSPVSTDAIEEYRRESQARDRSEAGRLYVEELLHAASSAPRGQIWQDLLVDDDSGDLWVGLHAPTRASPSRYLQLAPDGTVLSRWQFPPRTRLLAARASWWIVALVDEDDVESLGIIER